MLSRTTENGTFHESRSGAGLAERLVANGTPQDLAVAEKVLDATLECQELREGDPHLGNFFWMREDEAVGDLNAVEFCLERLIPMMIRHADRLPAPLQTRVLEAIRLGLAEVRSLDVNITYSNITVLDILNSCLGGELLDDSETAQRGYRKLVRWMAFTDRNGTPREFNSPTYTGVVIRALKRLVDLCQHEPTCIRARTASARLALSVGLHLHRGTGRWAGPHSRAYHPTVVCESRPEADAFRSWIDSGTVPSWTGDVHDRPDAPYEVTETADAALMGTCHTYHGESFCLGVATREYGGQSDVMIAHYVREGAERPGVLYTRYLVDDRWLGDFYHATDRTTSRNLMEEGRFLGVLGGPRAIGLYTPRDATSCASAKACFIFTQREMVDQIWIGNTEVSDLPADVPAGEVVVVASGSATIALRPLSRRDMGRDAPVRLVEKQGDLVLEIFNYLGPKKAFWEMRSEHPFFKGHPECGVYVELAERDEYPDAAAFGRLVSSGSFTDAADEPFVADGDAERIWTVEYVRDGVRLGIQADLMAWKLKRRWVGDQVLGWPMLDSPMAAQTDTGEVVVGNARLTCGRAPAWLYGNPETRVWAAGYHGCDARPLTLHLPVGEISVPRMGTGTVVWDRGAVSVDAIDLEGEPQVTGGRLASSSSPTHGSET